jgi:hypothetical protein
MYFLACAKETKQLLLNKLGSAKGPHALASKDFVK